MRARRLIGFGVAALPGLLGLGCSGSDDTRGGGEASGASGTAGAGTAAGSAGAGDGSTASGGTSAAPGSGGSAPGTGGASGNAGAPAGAGAAGSGNADGTELPGVRFVGRVDASDPAAARFAWSGTGVVARFTGSGLAVRLADTQQYTVLVDGALQPKLLATGGSAVLATALGPGEHVVELYRRTEASQGPSAFAGFDITGGALLSPPPAAERRIEIIGDSISAGYGNEGADESCPFSPDTENHYLTYGAISARQLSAELSTVAWSGKGVVCNYGDDAQSCVDPMPGYFDRLLPDQPGSVWDFSRFQPQAVVINLGTNDFSTDSDPSEAEFVAAYVALLERVRGAYPEAMILCTVGPLLNGADLTTARDYIESAVAQRLAAGDAGLRTFELDPQDPSNGLGCDYHPSLVTHEIMADLLTATLQVELGW
jgi:lysophospholipase L1-like esterase